MKVDLTTLPAECRVADIVAVAHALGHELSIEAVPIAPDESCEWVCPGCLETVRGSFPEVRDNHKCKPSVEIPPLSSYARAGDYIWCEECKDSHVLMSRDANGDWSFMAADHRAHSKLSPECLDANFRLVLCYENVAAGDVLLWDGKRAVTQATNERCVLRRDDGHEIEMKWTEVDEYCKMLVRSPKREDAEC